ncbi:MAG TPA: AI-2E family transporter [Acetobacteraceae bacterium]
MDATLRALAVGAALLLVAWALRDVLLLAFAAVLAACALRLASDRLSTATRLTSGWCLALVVTALLLVLGLFGWWRGGVIAAQATDLGDNFSDRARELWTQVGQTSWGARLADQARDAVESSLASVGGYLTGFARSTLGIGGSALLVGVAALFIAAAPGTYVDGALRLLPPRVRGRGREVLAATGRALQLWFLGQLLDMLVVAVLIGAGLYLLGVPLALTLALFAGLLNFVPFIGALAGAVPAVLVAFGQSPSQALWVAGLFAVVQTLEGNVIAPLIQRRTVSLPPALTLFSQTVLGTLFGPLGLILATPVMAATLVAVRMAYVESVLERPDGDGA